MKKSTQSRPAYAVLSVREIRNLLAIAERSAAVNAANTGTSVENTVVILRGEVSVGKRGETSHVRIDAAGYYGGDFTLWSQTPVAS